jgi:hypothetical protein
MWGFIVLALCVFVIFLLPAKKNIDESYKYFHENELFKINQCRDSGGIPITSQWDGRLENCIYKPNK